MSATRPAGLVHASTSNRSPWSRGSACLSVCAVSNPSRRHKRPDFIDCAVDMPWKNGLTPRALRTSEVPMATHVAPTKETA